MSVYEQITEPLMDWIPQGVKNISFRAGREYPILAGPKGGVDVSEGWAHHRERLSGADMTYTFKLASRLARFRSAGMLAILFTLACAGTESISEPGSDPDSNLPGSIEVSPDHVTVGADGDVQFDARASDSVASARYGWWRSSRSVEHVRVRPDWIRVAPGGSQALSATAQTSRGYSVSVTFLWKATGGTVSETGRYVAGKVPGRYIVVATAPNGVADTAGVVITDAADRPNRSVVLTPSAVTLAPNAQHEFSVAGKDNDGSSFPVDPEYSATGGTISRGGTYTAGRTPGTYRVIATDDGTGLADTAAVIISGDDGGPEDPAVASVTVSPSSTALTLGETKQLSAAVRDGQGKTVPSAAVSWASSDPNVAKVSVSGLVTATRAGSTTITASSGGKRGEAAVTVRGPEPPPPPPPSGGSFASCENLPAATRTVNVSNQSALGSALANAQPGDRIVLAPGTYDGSRKIAGRSGTQSQPIVLCGPRSAVLTGDVRPEGINWWIFQGFTIRDVFQAFYARGVRNVRVQGLEIYNVGQEGIHFLCNSTDNVAQANYVHDTGRSKTTSGEAVYLGTYPPQVSQWCGFSGYDQSSRNQVIGNRFGPNVTAEDMQAQPGSNDGVFRGNTSDGTGKRTISGHFDASVALSNNTSGWLVEGNTLKPAAQDGAVAGNGIVVYSGASGHQIRGNTIDMRGASGYAIRISGSGTMTCDNSVSNGRLSNVSCR
jgi:hypothetical protein